MLKTLNDIVIINKHHYMAYDVMDKETAKFLDGKKVINIKDSSKHSYSISIIERILPQIEITLIDTISTSQLLKNWRFEDGSICGVKID